MNEKLRDLHNDEKDSVELVGYELDSEEELEIALLGSYRRTGRDSGKTLDLTDVIGPLARLLNQIEIHESVPNDLVIVAKLRRFLADPDVDSGVDLPLSLAANLTLNQLLSDFNLVQMSKYELLIERPIRAGQIATLRVTDHTVVA
jgi:hypothetical protein